MTCDGCGRAITMYYVNYGARLCLACVKKDEIRRIDGPWFVRGDVHRSSESHADGTAWRELWEEHKDKKGESVA
jgi:hypothetical protein